MELSLFFPKGTLLRLHLLRLLPLNIQDTPKAIEQHDPQQAQLVALGRTWMWIRRNVCPIISILCRVSSRLASKLNLNPKGRVYKITPFLLLLLPFHLVPLQSPPPPTKLFSYRQETHWEPQVLTPSCQSPRISFFLLQEGKREIKKRKMSKRSQFNSISPLLLPPRVFLSPPQVNHMTSIGLVRRGSICFCGIWNVRFRWTLLGASSSPSYFLLVFALTIHEPDDEIHSVIPCVSHCCWGECGCCCCCCSTKGLRSLWWLRIGPSESLD